jgi:murein DD-endopeptidase MepM/ murein hydrolase activator NlpD
MTRDRLRPALLARRILLPPLLAGLAATCVLVALAAGGSQRAKASNPLAGADLVQQLSTDLEGTPSAADVLRARLPPSERERRLAAHPYVALYKLAKRRFDVPWLLVAAVHFQETGFVRAPDGSARDDFGVVMAIGAELREAGARDDLGRSAARALAVRYGTDAGGRLSAAMVSERARAWKVLGVPPLPGRGELATPVKGIVPGCGYFGCPRPGHLHNGLDLLAPTGTAVHAAESGTVAVLESVGESGGYGNLVCVQHRPHLATCYAHLSAVAEGLRIGTRVRRGGAIGLVGQTGSATAPHLHFEVRRGAAACQRCAVDPAPFLDGDVPQAIVPALVGLVGSPAAARAAPRAVAPVPAPAPMTGSSVGGGRHPLSGRKPPRSRAPALPARRAQPAPAPTTTTTAPPAPDPTAPAEPADPAPADPAPAPPAPAEPAAPASPPAPPPTPDASPPAPAPDPPPAR